MSDTAGSETNDETNMSLSELKIKLYEEQNSGSDWKSRLDENDVTKSLSPSALSSDASSVHSGKFDTEFCVGQRIEVKDYRTDTWYTAKIMEVDYDDREIFIHYERWSVRFDEWLKWDSQRIRKAKLSLSHHRFKVGEHVLATWSYTKKYPAAVKSVLPDDKYEVLFYDGFAKILKGNRITKIDPRQFNLLEKMPKEIPRAPPIGADLDVRNIGTKEERRQKKRRLNVVELLQSGKRKRGEELASPAVSTDTSPDVQVRRRRRRQPAGDHSSPRIVAPVEKCPDNVEVSSKVNNITKSTAGGSYSKILKKKNSNDNISNEEEETKIVSNNTDRLPSSVKRDKDENVKALSIDCVNHVNEDGKDEKKQPDGINAEESIEDSPSNLEKDSNSEQDFPGFETPPLIKSEGYNAIDNSMSKSDSSNNSAAVPLVIKKVPPHKASSNLSLPLQTVRRISKRGRIPKLKTSLGNITSTPRLSAFPKIKPRGRIYKPNEHSKGSGRIGRSRVKHISAGIENVENNCKNLLSSNPIMNISAGEKSSNEATSIGCNEPISECGDTSINNERMLRNERNISNDLLLIKNGSAGSSTDLISAPSTGSSPGNNLTDGNTRNVYKQEGLPSPAFGNDHVKRKGRRFKKSYKKSDEKRGKNIKMINRRKLDEDDDPERWSGDIPEGAKPVFIDGGDGKMRQSIIIPDKKLPTGWTKHTIIRKNSSKWDVLLVNPNGRKFRSRKDLRTYYNEMNKDYPEDCFDFVVGRTKMTSNLIEMETMAKKQGLSPPSLKIQNKKKEIRKSGSEDGFSSMSPSHSTGQEGEKRVKTLMPKTKLPPLNDDEVIVSAAAAAVAVSAVTSNPITGCTFNNSSVVGQQLGPTNKTIPVLPLAPKLSSEIAQISGTSTPDSDGAASWICPKDGCGKHFRKENLLQMHIKHYHPEYNQFLDSAPNVADLAYARTVGEPLDETIGAASFLDRISRYEARKKAKADGCGVSATGATVQRKPYSPLRKALLKGLPSKDVSECSDDLGDMSKVDSSPSRIQGKHGDGPDHDRGDVTDGDSDRFTFDNDRGRFNSNSDEHASEYGNASNSHSTLKELLSGNFDDSASNSPMTPTTGTRSSASNASFRFATKSKPLVALEKLNVTTDSNGRVLLDKKEQDYVKLCEKTSDSIPDNDHELSADVSIGTEIEPEDLLKKEEIINCLCGYAEEDGLMIQCDLCLCWQHGFCNNIKQESDVPEKYICCICRNPKKLRSSYKYSYNFDWLKEGKLPVLSFRNQNQNVFQQRESLLKRSHDLVSTLLQLQKVVKSLRLKTHIAGKSDHPKLYLWSKKWEKEAKTDAKVNKTEDKQIEVKSEDVKKELDDNDDDIKQENQSAVEATMPKGPQAPVPEAPIDLVECRLRLLEHIEDYQSQVESRLLTLESQIVALESQDPDLASDESPDFYPQTKQTVQMLMRDLSTVRKVMRLN